jgi:hypothetical protein
MGGTAQQRYERLRSYVLLDPARRPRVSPERFDLERFRRFGLLGLVDGQPARQIDERFEVQVVPLGTDDAADRWARLCELLGGLMTMPREGDRRSGRRRKRRSRASLPPSRGTLIARACVIRPH